MTKASTLTVDELIEALPAAAHQLQSAVPYPAVFLPEAPAPFVPPVLRTIRDGGVTRPFILISAPGAVGKTTLGAALGAACSGWMWDLSKLSLGDNSFVGTIAKVFGSGRLASVLNDFGSGRQVFLFDAFDEAEVLSGWQRIETFVRELWDIAKDAPHPVAVLLSRSETASLLDILLHDLADGTPRHETLEVDYFDQSAAEQFVNLQMEEAGTDSHRVHREPFRAALHALFDAVAAGMGLSSDMAWQEEQGRSFLGYAPVLQAIAKFLASTQNFRQVAVELSSRGDDRIGINVINDLIDKLLQREQGKLVNALKERHPQQATWNGWNDLYGRDEQLRRILRYRNNQPTIGPADISNLPTWLHETYIEAVTSLLPNHPFLRNRSYSGPAFRDFTLGYMLRDSAFATLAEAELNTASFIPTVLLARFYLRASKDPANARHFGYIYESATAARAFMDVSRTTLAPVNGGGPGHALVIDTGSDSSEASASHVTAVMNVSDESPVIIRSRLRNASLAVRGQVNLGLANSDEVELENVQVSADSLFVQGRSVIARCFDKTGGVELQADKYNQASPDLTVRKLGAGTFAASWPGSGRYPWSQASSDLTTGTIDMDAAVFALSRILSWFRRDRKKELAKYWEFIENVAVGGHPVRRKLLNYMLAQGVLARQGEFYVINVDRASNFAISYGSIRQKPIPPQLHDFLKNFLQS